MLNWFLQYPFRCIGDDTSLNNVRAKCCSVAGAAADLLPGAPSVPVIGVTDAPAMDSTAAPAEP